MRKMFETNFFALAAMTRLVLPGMRARRSGHVVNISSVGGLVGNPASGYYNATKDSPSSRACRRRLRQGSGSPWHSCQPDPSPTRFVPTSRGRSMTAVAKPIDAYAETRARDASSCARATASSRPGACGGCHHQGRRSARSPLHLVLGANGVQRVREALHETLRSVDEWETVSLGADFRQLTASDETVHEQRQ